MKDNVFPLIFGASGTGLTLAINHWVSLICGILTIIYLGISIYKALKK